MKSHPKKEYEIVIQPNSSWLYFDWKGLLEYRDLLVLLVRRDFLARYKQTLLGPAWFILQPLLTTVIFTVIFGKGVKISTEGIPPYLFYFCALVPWSYFSQCLSAISLSLTGNANLFRKVYFPRLIIPLSIILSNLMAFLLQLFTFLGFYFYFKFFTPQGAQIHPTAALFFLPLLLLQTAATSLGVGLWVAALTVKYRDFQHLVTFAVQLWMYLTPVIYPASVIPERWRFLIAFNPMAGVVECHRYAFFGTGMIESAYLSISAFTALFFLLTGLLIFNKVQRTFVDTL